MLILMLFFFISAIVLTIILNFPQFKILKIIKKSKNKRTKQMFYLSLATNLGVGNLIGVSSALYYGGPGVIFWMAIFSFFSSSFSYLESKYAILSKEVIKGEYRTGTCYTIKNFINNKLGRILSIVFAIILLLTNSIFFPPIQINTIVNIVEDEYRIIWGILLFLIISFITFRGINSILKVTDRIMPLASLSYFLLITSLILFNYKTIIPTVQLIIKSAFDIKTIGVSGILVTIKIAVNKSLFSNEAGLGTMPSLLGESDNNEIEEVSNYQMLSVIFDTAVLCTLTGIFILQNNNLEESNISQIFTISMYNLLGNIGLVISKVFLFIFGFASVIGQFYLGESNALFIKKNNIKFIFNILFSIGIIIGIFMSFRTINYILDIGMIILGVFNILVIFVIKNKQKNNKNT